MLPLPDSPTDTIKLADWMEFLALLSPDQNASRGDLEGALRIASPFSAADDDAIENIIIGVFYELEDRSKAAGKAYPFKIEGPVLQTGPNWREYPSYVFCLCLSYLGGKEKKGSKVFPARYFEHISRDAAIQYLGGEGVRFASPREATEISINFQDAIGKICKELNEGDGYKKGKGTGVKDDDVDIIAWKHFPDRNPGKIILFGNCATQSDWEASKKSELDPDAFSQEWFLDPLRSKPIKSFFIPHRVEYKVFCYHLRRAGIIFDRCRIAYWLYTRGPISQQEDGASYLDYSILADWSQRKLEQLKVNS